MLQSMRDSGEEVAELMVSYDEIYGTFKIFCPFVSSTYLGLSYSFLLFPILLTCTSYPSSCPTEGVVPWLGALILEFRSIMGLMMSAGEASQISQGTNGGGQTGEETLNCERVTCPHSGRGKREDNARGILCFHSIIIQAHAYCACTSGREREGE